MMSTLAPEASVNSEHWRGADSDALTEAGSFAELADVALTVLQRLPQPVGQVCGPISNGGVGSVAGNLIVFGNTIDMLAKQGISIFDQRPFETHFNRIENTKGDEWGIGPRSDVLNGFYLPLFDSKLVNTFYFIHGWESSDGARWEHEQAERLDINTIYLKKGYGA